MMESNDKSSGMSAAVAVVAIIAILAIVFFLAQSFLQQMENQDENELPDINVPIPQQEDDNNPSGVQY